MRLAPVTSTPASTYVSRAQWLLHADSVVRSLEVVDATTVRILVRDQFVSDPHDRVEADRLAADSARTVLEQAAHGVKVLTTTDDGYTGELRELAPAQLTFASGLPGVQRYDLVPDDLDHDGTLLPHEVAHRIEVDADATAARIDWLLRDRFAEGSVHDGVVQVVVPARAWRGSAS